MTSDPQQSPSRKIAEMYCPTCDESYEVGAKHCPNDGAKLIALMEKKDTFVGRVIEDRFTIKERLGKGGMGAVYRALQHSVGREVAVKVIDPRLADHREVVKRFLREAQLASRLSQPNTVTVVDFGQTHDGILYLVMELLKGKSLDALVEKEGALPLARVKRIGIQLCDALDAAHGLAIVHRDLKPANIVILDDPPGRDMVKVLDFGIAKSLAGDSALTTVTKTDMILGTPSYMAPEASAGSDIDHRADLYSLGVILYELSAGRLPFKATTVNAMLSAHVSQPPDAMGGDVPAQLREVIFRLLAKRPGDRYESAAQVRRALTEIEVGTGTAIAAVSTQLRGSADSSVDSMAATMTPAPVSKTAEPMASGLAAGHGVSKAPMAQSMALDKPASNRAPLFIALLLLVLGGAAGAFFLLKGGDEKPVASASAAGAAKDDSPEAAGPSAKDDSPEAAGPSAKDDLGAQESKPGSGDSSSGQASGAAPSDRASETGAGHSPSHGSGAKPGAAEASRSADTPAKKPPAKKPKPMTRTYQIDVQPPGRARVSVVSNLRAGGQRRGGCKKLPCSVSLEGESKDVVVKILRPGYRPWVKTVSPTTLRITGTMKKVGSAKPPTKPATQPSEKNKLPFLAPK